MSPRYWLAALAVFAILGAGCARPPAPRNGPRVALNDPTTTRRSSVPTAIPRRPFGATNTENPPATTPARPKPGEPILTVNQEAGVISGQVRWEGPLPEQADKTARRLQINGKNQGIGDAVIWLALPGSTVQPGAGIQVAQRESKFRPRVQVVTRGTSLEFLTADPQASFKASGAIDFTCEVVPGKPVVRELKNAGLVELRSELKPEACAYVWVFDQPYFARTDADGRFRLTDVPVGKYQLMLWHEGWTGTPGSRQVRKELQGELVKGQGVSVQWPLSGRDAEGKSP